MSQTADESTIWKGFSPVPGPPLGLSLRTTLPPNPDGVEVMLERWEGATFEAPHSHPGDDMTVVVEGRMLIQFFRREGEALVTEGESVELRTGETGYIAANRIHDARYVEACKLVYVHDGTFGFRREA